MSNIIGLKLTHDATICYLEDGQLTLSHEMEKLSNRQRYTKMDPHDLRDLPPHYVVAVDGWKTGRVLLGGQEYEVAPYHEFELSNTGNPMQRFATELFILPSRNNAYCWRLCDVAVFKA